MDEVSREQVLDSLENGWGTYVDRFRALPPGAQADYLRLQGYARLADLLAHVTAWFQETLRAIPALQADHGWKSPDYDVDAFNAEAVRQAAALDEDAAVKAFEAERLVFVALARALTEDDLHFKRINRRLAMDAIGHLAEHALPSGQPPVTR